MRACVHRGECACVLVSVCVVLCIRKKKHRKPPVQQEKEEGGLHWREKQGEEKMNDCKIKTLLGV